MRVAAGSGALRDVSNPVGRGDPLEAAYLLASRYGLRPEDSYDAVSSSARAVMGLPEVRVEAGFPAELLALRGDRLAGALSLAYSRIVVHRGRVVARTSAVREYCNSAAAPELGLPRQGRPGPRPGRRAVRRAEGADVGRRGRGARAAGARRTVGNMRIVIAGGHGQIALRLERLLAARGDEVAGIIRTPEQATTCGRPVPNPSCWIWSRPRSRRSRRAARAPTQRSSRRAPVQAAGQPARKPWTRRGGPVCRRGGSGRRTTTSGRLVDGRRSDPPGGRHLRRVPARQGRGRRSRTRLDALDGTILRPGTLTNDAGTGLVRLEAHDGPRHDPP